MATDDQVMDPQGDESTPVDSPLASSAPDTSPKTPAQVQSQLQGDRAAQLQRAQQIQSILNAKYGQYQQGANALKDLLQDTAARLRATAVGPSQAERYGQFAAALSAPTRSGTFAERMGNVGAASAQSLAQAREQELAKQELLAKYGMEAGQLGLNASQMGIQQMSSQENNANNRLTSLDTAISNANKPNSLVVMGANGQPQANQPLIDAQVQLARAKAAAQAKGRLDVMGGSLTPEGLDYAIDVYRTTGKLPTGLSRLDPTAPGKIISGAAEKAAMDGNNAQADVFGQNAYKASSAALAQVTKQQNMVGAFEKTAEKNLDLALAESEKVDRSGSPLVNKAIMAWKQGVAGDPETAGFVNALTTFKNEYAKVLSGATGAQGITDSARHEADELFSKIQSKESLQYVANIARQEMGNRMSSFNDQLAQLHDLMTHHTPAGNQPASTTAASASPTQLPKTNTKGWTLHTDAKGRQAYVSPDGKQYELAKLPSGGGSG